MRLSWLILLAAVCLTIGGCATVRPLYINVNESYAAHPEGYSVLGMVEGQASVTQILFFGPSGDAGYRAAIDDAVKKAGADALINVVADVKVVSGIFVTTRTTIVRGLAIKKK
jgi:hypothetical protein